MNHREVADRKLAELYLNNELSSEEELAFEEHILECNICRNHLQMLEEAREAIESHQQDKFRNPEKKSGETHTQVNQRFFLLRIAAVIILLIGFTGIGYIFLAKRGSHPVTPSIAENKDETLLNAYPVDSTEKNSKNDNKGSEENNKEQKYLAESLEASVFYENLVKENFRNTELTVISPVTDTLKQLPVFKWEESEIKTLTLIIINNREKKIYTEKIKNGTCPDIKIEPGLYYWQLQDMEETLLTGKFIYLPVNDR